MSDAPSQEQIEAVIGKLTPAQRRTFDQVCLSELSGALVIGHPKTLAKLERLGLLRGIDRVLPGPFRGSTMTIHDYRVPIPVHMAWCAVCDREITKR